MNRSDVLEQAGAAISGDRHDKYGDARDNFANIAAGWQVIFGVDVTAEQVALAMVWVKTARLLQTPSHDDSWLDMAGYAALGGEVSGD